MKYLCDRKYSCNKLAIKMFRPNMLAVDVLIKFCYEGEIFFPVFVLFYLGGDILTPLFIFDTI